METTSSADGIVGWGSHHGRVEHSLSLVGVIVVLEVLPDPEGTGVVRTVVVSYNKLFANSVVSVKSLFAGLGDGPVDGFLVDIGTSVANFIIFMEIRVSVSETLLHRLAGHQLSLEFNGTNLILAGVEGIKSFIVSFGHRDGLDCA